MRLARATPLRVLSDRDLPEAFAVLDADAVANVFVASRVRAVGLNSARLGAEVWGYYNNRANGRLESLCYAGANMVPVRAGPEAVDAFAERALRQGRQCSSIVGPAESVQRLWEVLGPYWGPARTVRAYQPLMSISGPPPVPADPAVRRVGQEELDILLPACVAMFTEEVGVPPDVGDNGGLYRSRIAELIRLGRSFARIDDGEVTFKAEIGAVTRQACQVQGVWVHPQLRGRGLATPGMSAVVSEALRTVAPTVSLYVNSFNAPARATYRHVGLTEVGAFMSVLF